MLLALGMPYNLDMDANQIIDALGGTAETARICEVSMPSVSEWRSKNHIPAARLMYLRLLRPDVFVTVSAEKVPIPEEKRVS